MKVPPLVAYLAMCSGYGPSGPFPPMSTALAAGEVLLDQPQPLLAFTVVAWVLDRFTGGQRGKVEQTQVQPNGFLALRQRFRFHFTGEADVPRFGFVFDRAGFHPPLHLPV